MPIYHHQVTYKAGLFKNHSNNGMQFYLTTINTRNETEMSSQSNNIAIHQYSPRATANGATSGIVCGVALHAS